MRRGLSIALTIAALAAGQPPAPPSSLNFEVASLKPSQSRDGPSGIRPAPGGQRYVATNIPLRILIWVAYRLTTNQVVGGPDWIDTDTYDMNAEASRPSSIDELRVMLQDLLAERFKLQFHHETQEMPVYVLTVNKSGPRNLNLHEARNGSDPTTGRALEGLHEKWAVRFASMNYFAWALSQMTDRPVIDETGLKGEYDFDLAYTHEPPDLPQGNAALGRIPNDQAAIDASGPTLFEALEKQLGLKLEAKKAPVDILVIDHAEKPSEN